MQPKCLENLVFRSQNIAYADYLIYLPQNKKDTYSIEMHNLWEHIKRKHFPSKSLNFNLVMEN